MLGRIPDDAAKRISERAWRELARRLSGRLLRPGDPRFVDVARPHNLRYAKVLPAGIARCRSSNEVAQAILWCREHDVPLAARSGGHSYAGFSTTRGLMIDVGAMNATRFNAAEETITIDGGARNGDLYKALPATGMTITHGRCPTVGAAGFLLGGGIGFNMRALGVGCDQLVATDIVTADGNLQTVNAHDDLFWACCGGGGGNFGINTSFTVRTFPTAPVTVFRMAWNVNSEEVFAALMRALDAAPSGLGARVSLGAPRQRDEKRDVPVRLLGQLKGSARELADILAPVPPGSSTEIFEKSYWDGQAFLEEPGPPEYFQERSTFLTGTLDSNALATAFDWLRRWPGTSVGADLRFFQTGGKINERAADATAYVHRNNRWLMLIGLGWEACDPPDLLRQNRAWQDGFYQAMLPYGTGGAYQNFADPSLNDWGHAYYGANFERLRRVKAAVDRKMLFQFAQAIPPAE
ncbi:MAG: FAD-binding oxidoreductase [Hyphomicrobiales bacterium]|nr:FAD-binding oxidoreductase [Hyphomicrobiales bacterium]